jgi:hypothetical protein
LRPLDLLINCATFFNHALSGGAEGTNIPLVATPSCRSIITFNKLFNLLIVVLNSSRVTTSAILHLAPRSIIHLYSFNFKICEANDKTRSRARGTQEDSDSSSQQTGHGSSSQGVRISVRISRLCARLLWFESALFNFPELNEPARPPGAGLPLLGQRDAGRAAPGHWHAVRT